MMVLTKLLKCNYKGKATELSTGQEMAEENIYQAIQFHIEGMELKGILVPDGQLESEVMVF